MNRGSMRSGHTTGTMPCLEYILYNINNIVVITYKYSYKHYVKVRSKESITIETSKGKNRIAYPVPL